MMKCSARPLVPKKKKTEIKQVRVSDSRENTKMTNLHTTLL